MRKIWKPKHKPQVGDIRERRVFLLFPKTRCDENGNARETRWLEYATIKERFCEQYDLDGQPTGNSWEFGFFLD